MSSIYDTLKDYTTCSLAAGGAIVAPFRLFEAKTALQRGQPLVPSTFAASLFRGWKASPLIAGIIGTQMGTQELIEKALVHDGEEARMTEMVQSTALVAVISAPLLAAFNGRTMGYSTLESFKRLQLGQIGAIATRELFFVGALRGCDPLAIKAKELCGDYKSVELATSFLSGFVGSVAGHAGDTILTRSQANLRVIYTPVHLMAGAVPKGVATGMFAALYYTFKTLLKSE